MANDRALVLVLDSAEPEKLADFYGQLLGGETRVEPDLAHLSIVGPHGVLLMIRRNEGMVPPVWPQTGLAQQAEMRLNVPAENLDAVEREIVSLGGQPLDIEGGDGSQELRTFADPEGHAFALAES